jgi:type IV pilus assembly protein PilM
MQSRTFLCIAAGAHSIKMGQFQLSEHLKLTGFGTRVLARQRGGEEGSAFKQALEELLQQFKGRSASLAVSSSLVFSKVLKLPSVDNSKLRQMIPYEAQQNIPFPIDEAVWDYQILSSAASGELEILMAAAKVDTIENTFRAAEGTGLRLDIVDASTTALHNAFRFNYPDVDGCVALLDIGGKTSNLLIFDNGRFFARTIALGANTITSELMAEAKLSFGDAEKLKMEEGFVGLGGAYEEPENPREACLVKVARQFMTRLHIQVNQTFQSYRTQQGGAAPMHLFLAGGGSGLPFTAEFFEEKLGTPVKYFNPFRRIEVDSTIAEIGKEAHCFGEVVGLALRKLAHCPLEINLIPKSIRAKQEFARRRPFIAGAVGALGLFMALYAIFLAEISQIKREALAQIAPKVAKLKARMAELQTEQDAIAKGKSELNILSGHLQEKYAWADRLTEMRQILIDSEKSAEQGTGKSAGVWIERLSLAETVPTEEEEVEPTPPSYFYEFLRRDPTLAKRLFLPEQLNSVLNGQVVNPEKQPKEGGSPAVFATFRAVNLNSAAHPADNGGLAYLVEQRFKSSPLFNKDETKLRSFQPEEEGEVTFTFDMQLKPNAGGKLQ